MKYLSRTIEYGLYLLVFLLPLQTRWIIRPGILNSGPWEYGTISLYGTDILLILLLLLFVIYLVCQKKFSIFNFQFSNNFKFFNFRTNQKFKLAWLLIGGLVLASAVSIFFAADKLLALYKLGWLMMGVGLFWLINRADYSRLKLIWSLLAGMALQSLLAIWQFLSQATFQSKWFGLSFHQAGELGTAVIETISQGGQAERWLRAYGGMDHPNMLGGLIAVGALLLVGEIIREERTEKKFLIFNFKFLNKFQILNRPPSGTSQFLIKSWADRKGLMRASYWALVALFSAALFFSFSRSAWLGLGAGLAAILSGAVIRRNLMAQKFLLQVLLVMGAMFFIMFLIYPNLVSARLYSGRLSDSGQIAISQQSAPNRLEIQSVSERRELLKNSWAMINNSWISGVGIGNYGLALRDRLRQHEQSYFYQPVHNVFLLVWSETGIFGFMFFLGIIIYSLIRNLLVPERGKALNYGEPVANFSYRKVNVGALLAVIIIMSLDHWLWSLHFGVLFFWLLSGIVMRDE